MRYSWAGSATGKDFSMMACVRVKIAVVAPMPMARVSNAVNVNVGAWRSCRRGSGRLAEGFARGYPPADYTSTQKRWFHEVNLRVFNLHPCWRNITIALKTSQ